MMSIDADPSHDNEHVFTDVFANGKELAGASKSRHRRHLFIPIHPPKFGFVGTAFAKTFAEDGDHDDIVLTFMLTSKVEREMFENYIKLSGIKFPVEHEIISAVEICEWLSIEGAIPCFRDNLKNGIVNFKKMLGIYRALCAGAEQIACIDIDVIFLRHPRHMFDRLEHNFGKKLVLAGYPDKGQNIMKECARVFSPADEEKLMGLTRDGTLYNWFFDAPFYPRRETIGFFNHISAIYGGIEDIIKRLMWGTFEHTMFQYYLMLYEGHEIVDIQRVAGPRVTDDLWLYEVIDVAKTFDYLPVWAPLGAMVSYVNPDELRMVEDTFLLAMHVDRVPGRPQD